MSQTMLFDGWENAARVVAVGVPGYVLMVAALRIAGKRTLAKMNAFDLVVTVALGSVLATIALSRDVSLSEGVVAILLLVAAQWAVSWLSLHSPWAARIVRADATVLFRDGTFDGAAMAQARVLPSEVDQAIRASGCGGHEMVAAVVLETDGSLSVVPSDRCGSGTALPGNRPEPAIDDGTPHHGASAARNTKGSTS